MGAWNGFFQVQAGASAALLGLVFLGLSINSAQIMGTKHLPNRALEAMLVLFLNLSLSMLFLVPNQSHRLLGGEVLVLATLVWAVTTRMHFQIHRHVEARFRRRAIAGTAIGQIAMLSWWVGGAILTLQGAVGLYWLVPSFLLGYFGALIIAWVLLVEINR